MKGKFFSIMDAREELYEDGESYAGFGEAEFARWRYRSGREAFSDAVRLNQADDASRRRLVTYNEILALDRRTGFGTALGTLGS